MKIEEKLKSRGKKITPERIKLFNKMNTMHLFESKDLIESFPEIGRASIFRSIKLFLEIGAIRRVNLGESAESYEVDCCSKCRHEHMKCTSCGEIISFYSANVSKKIYEEARKLGFHIDEYSVNVFGKCNNCN